MEKTKQVLKSFPLDAEAEQALKILKDKGFNVSHLLREFLKEEAKKHMAKKPEPTAVPTTPVPTPVLTAPRLSAKGIDYEVKYGVSYEMLSDYLIDKQVNGDTHFTWWDANVWESDMHDLCNAIAKYVYKNLER